MASKWLAYVRRERWFESGRSYNKRQEVTIKYQMQALNLKKWQLFFNVMHWTLAIWINMRTILKVWNFLELFQALTNEWCNKLMEKVMKSIKISKKDLLQSCALLNGNLNTFDPPFEFKVTQWIQDVKKSFG